MISLDFIPLIITKNIFFILKMLNFCHSSKICRPAEIRSKSVKSLPIQCSTVLWICLLFYMLYLFGLFGHNIQINKLNLFDMTFCRNISQRRKKLLSYRLELSFFVSNKVWVMKKKKKKKKTIKLETFWRRNIKSIWIEKNFHRDKLYNTYFVISHSLYNVTTRGCRVKFGLSGTGYNPRECPCVCLCVYVIQYQIKSRYQF